MSIEYLSLIIALVALVISPLTAIYVARLHINAQVRSNNRQRWLDNLRDELSAFVGCVRILHSFSKADFSDDRSIGLLQEAMTRWQKIQLYLNPIDADHKRLIEKIQEALYCVSPGGSKKENSAAKLETAIQEITTNSQKIAKRVWEAVKKGK